MNGMKFSIDHTNINVRDLDESLRFYKAALGLHEVRTIDSKDGSFKLIFLSDEKEQHSIELTWVRDRDTAYDLGDNEWHICFRPDDYEAAYQFHSEQGWICYENKEMGLYFIEDPDGYWLEIVP